MILVFDLPTILSGCTRDWVDFSNHAPCYLPEVVLQELNFLTQRAVTAKEEKIAREFSRFFPDSGWEITATMSAHPAISPKEAENLSKQARLSVAIAESVYDLALKKFSESEIVIFVSDNGNLKRELNQIQQPNLATISTAQLKQWIRTEEIPSAVQEILTKFPNQNHRQIKNSLAKNNQFKQTNSASLSQKSSSTSTNRSKSEDSILTILKSTFLAITTLTLTVAVAWYFIAPKSFLQTWQKLGLPPLERKNK